MRTMLALGILCSALFVFSIGSMVLAASMLISGNLRFGSSANVYTMTVCGAKK